MENNIKNIINEKFELNHRNISLFEIDTIYDLISSIPKAKLEKYFIDITNTSTYAELTNIDKCGFIFGILASHYIPRELIEILNYINNSEILPKHTHITIDKGIVKTVIYNEAPLLHPKEHFFTYHKEKFKLIYTYNEINIAGIMAKNHLEVKEFDFNTTEIIFAFFNYWQHLKSQDAKLNDYEIEDFISWYTDNQINWETIIAMLIVPSSKNNQTYLKKIIDITDMFYAIKANIDN